MAQYLALRMTHAVLNRLAPGGRFLIYTGSAIIGGRDHLLDSLRECAAAGGYSLTYEEIDPDVFGDELMRPAYADVDRIAAVGAVFSR